MTILRSKIVEMEDIFHEEQEGNLCAQHCLNALLQGQYYTPEVLAQLAHQLDDAERRCMAESGEDSQEYQEFIRQGSSNVDDSGNFSVQVITKALEVWGLELVPYSSNEERAREANENPTQMQAYICNYDDHWFTIRRVGNLWFNLDSVLPEPELISETYLTLLLAQLQEEGYSVFVVFGNLPECEADKALGNSPAVSIQKTQIVPSEDRDESSNDLQETNQDSLEEVVELESNDDDKELQNILNLKVEGDKEDDSKNDWKLLPGKAKAVSLKCESNISSVSPSAIREEIRRKRLVFLERAASSGKVGKATSRKGKKKLQNASKVNEQAYDGDDEDDEEVLVKKAIALSLESEDNTASAAEREFIRRERLAYLGRASQNAEESSTQSECQ